VSQEIIPTAEYATHLESKYETVKVPVYKLRELFSIKERVFFDCKGTDMGSWLRRVLIKPDFPSFRIYLVVKLDAGYGFMDVNFRNLGNKETLEHFIERYHMQLETMTKLSLQSAGHEYIECVGYSYDETMP